MSAQETEPSTLEGLLQKYSRNQVTSPEYRKEMLDRFVDSAKYGISSSSIYHEPIDFQNSKNKSLVNGFWNVTGENSEYRAWLEQCVHTGETKASFSHGCDGVTYWEKIECRRCGILLASYGATVWNA